MDEEFLEAMQQSMQAMGPLMNQLADMGEQRESMQRWEYAVCLWHEVNEYARSGWKMVPGSVHPMPVTFTDPDDPEKTMQGTRTAYVMERKLSPESEAEAILRGVRDGSIPVVEFPNEVAGDGQS